MALILDGKESSKILKEQTKEKIDKYRQELFKKCPVSPKVNSIPILHIIVVGDNQASNIYIKNKIRACDEVGIGHIVHQFNEHTLTSEIVNLISQLNTMESVSGIIVQLPLPEHMDEMKIINSIDPSKDVDGFTTECAGELYLGQNPLYYPATAKGIIDLLDLYYDKLDYGDKKCVIVGRSNIVGKPIAMLMLERNFTVTICHSKTRNLKEECKQADVLIVAIGKPKFIDETYLKENAIVIDVGINRDKKW